MQLAEGQHAAAALRQRLDGLGENLKFLVMTDGLGDTGPVFKDGQELQICYAVDGDNFSAAKDIERGVARRGEKVGLRGAQGRLLAGLQQAGVGFLNQIVDIEMGGKPGTQVRSQLGFMGLHFLGKPTRGLGIGRGHDAVRFRRLEGESNAVARAAWSWSERPTRELTEQAAER